MLCLDLEWGGQTRPAPIEPLSKVPVIGTTKLGAAILDLAPRWMRPLPPPVRDILCEYCMTWQKRTSEYIAIPLRRNINLEPLRKSNISGNLLFEAAEGKRERTDLRVAIHPIQFQTDSLDIRLFGKQCSKSAHKVSDEARAATVLQTPKKGAWLFAMRTEGDPSTCVTCLFQKHFFLGGMPGSSIVSTPVHGWR